MISFMHSIGAFAVILDEQNRVLLCHRTDRDNWNLPGGTVEQAETPWDAVVREVEEEVGLIVRPCSLSAVYSIPSRSDLVFTFRCDVMSGQAQTSTEADQVQWFGLSELPDTLFESHRERIEDAIANHQTTLLKVQD
jgi:8-oxo-dGTP diphosphatase